MWLNRKVLEAPAVIVIGSVEPHYFAGFTGGRKSLFPGLTDFETIERNHNLAVSLACRPLRLEGNPVAEHLDNLLDLIDSDRILSIQVVLDSAGGVAGLFVGDIRQSFREAAHLASRLYAHTVAEAYDLVLCEMHPPLDRNLYQVQKALENCRGAVVEGGAVLLFSACREGIGSEAFFDLADAWDRENNRPADGIPRFGAHKLARVNALQRRIRVGLYSQLQAADVRRVFYSPVENPSSFIAGVCEKKDNYRVAVVRDAGHTVLTIGSGVI